MTVASLKTPIVYPEPDGEPMAESDPARDYLIYGVESLKFHFQNRENVYVSGNLWISYEQGVPDAAVCPDVFVIFGVENRPRTSYRVWLEGGMTPDWVLEVTSAKTWKKDEDQKPITYAQMGVSEYFQYDPTGDYLDPPLKGQRLVNGSYQPMTRETLEDGSISIYSEVLGLDVCLLANGQMRFFNPQTEEYLRSPAESERDRLAAETALQEAQTELEDTQAELEDTQTELEDTQTELEDTQTELEELRDRLAAMGLDPDNLP